MISVIKRQEIPNEALPSPPFSFGLALTGYYTSRTIKHLRRVIPFRILAFYTGRFYYIKWREKKMSRENKANEECVNPAGAPRPGCRLAVAGVALSCITNRTQRASGWICPSPRPTRPFHTRQSLDTTPVLFARLKFLASVKILQDKPRYAPLRRFTVSQAQRTAISEFAASSCVRCGSQTGFILN